MLNNYISNNLITSNYDNITKIDLMFNSYLVRPYFDNVMFCAFCRIVPILFVHNLNFELVDDAINQLIFIVDGTWQMIMYLPITICIEPMFLF
jgi:hypothetical protein